ncbi:MAG UNVERIFIED_CONTAM: hypothetical protein LVQ98_04910 [Rickettsiaceae bacterium]
MNTLSQLPKELDGLIQQLMSNHDFYKETKQLDTDTSKTEEFKAGVSLTGIDSHDMTMAES